MQRKASRRGATKRLVRRSSRPVADRRRPAAREKAIAKKPKPIGKSPRAGNLGRPLVTTYTYGPTGLCRLLDRAGTVHYNGSGQITALLERIAFRSNKRA